MIYQEPVQMRQIPDSALIDNVLSGDKPAFEHLIRRYNQRLFRIGMSMLGNESDSEDAMQSSYINAWLHLAQFRRDASFGTWLTRIMLNQCLEQQRKNRLIKTTIVQSDNVMNTRTPGSELANKELSSLLENAMSRLPEKYRLVFVMREVEDLSVKETSEVLDIGVSNVKTRLNRAKAMLREDLKGYMRENVYAFDLKRCDRIVAGVFAAIAGLP
ncbi:MAG TPA: RNA polymerase sigma factor [Puia sp.]|jgi:RNA polymerase sigma-70 factor (ECF subfamily)|nr:RNA polymerase sigma factor [Puia sp.]